MSRRTALPALALALLSFPSTASAQGVLHEIRGSRLWPLDGTVAEFGDFERDGVTDFLVGGVGGAFSGRTGRRVFGGVGLGPVDGRSGNVGDVDGDGTDDLLLENLVYSGRELTPQMGRRSRLRVISGFIPSLAVLEELGGSVPLGDRNGDGRREVLLGWPDSAILRCGGHRIVIVTGSSGGRGGVYDANGNPLWEIQGTATGDALGGFVARVGDLDADGLEDVLLGTRLSRGAYTCNFSQGRYLQARSAGTGALFWSIPVASFLPTASATGMDDVDGDGIPDLALGSYWSREVEVRSGASGALLWTIASSGSSQDMFGYRLQTVADLDGDTVRDVAIGAPQPAVFAPSTGPGFVRLVSGLSGATLATLNGRTLGGQFGASVVALGDVNGDGRPELAIGSPFDGAWGTVQVISLP